MSEFEVQLKYLKYLGVWEPQTKLQQRLFYAYRFVAIFIPIYLMFGEFTYGYFHYKDVFAVVEVMGPFFGGLLFLVKISSLWFYSDDIFDLIDDIKELNRNWCSQSNEKSISKATLFDRIFSRVYLWNGTLMGLSYALIPLVRDIDNYIMVYSPRPSRDMPIKTEFFYDSTSSPAYEITYLLFIYGFWLTLLTHAIVDDIFSGCAAYICAHFDILREIINDCEMKDFIDYHRKVINLVNELNRIYRLIIFCEYLILGIFVCMQGFSIVMMKDHAKIIIAFFSGSASFIQLFIYSLAGQMIMDMSMEVCDEVSHIDKNYLVIMMRSQQGEKIEAGFYHACLPLFTSIVNSIGSMITLLKSFV